MITSKLCCSGDDRFPECQGSDGGTKPQGKLGIITVMGSKVRVESVYFDQNSVEMPYNIIPRLYVWTADQEYHYFCMKKK